MKARGRMWLRGSVGAAGVLAFIVFFWSAFRLLSPRLGLDPSSWVGGAFAVVAALVLFGVGVNVAGIFFRRRHPDTFAGLIEAIRRITTGDFDVTLAVSERDHEHPFTMMAGELNLMVQSLKRMEEMRQEFISTVSHEIQSPLTSITGFARALREPLLQEEKRLRYLSIIEEESGRLSRLSDGLLRLTSLESKGIEPEAREYALDEQLRAVVLAAEPQWSDKRLELELELEPLGIKADSNMLGQVWTNLLNNAVKFSQPGGRVSIELGRSGERAVVSVSDEGVGIGPDDLDRVFERFFKADRSRARASGDSGSGLGLAIAKKIVELHGGSIGVRSRGVGLGCTFSVELPLGYEKEPPGEKGAKHG